ncbi:MAG: aminotransferase class III-fold pyridoxal phosphate-dependent enzyme [Chloroflexota bacterium]
MPNGVLYNKTYPNITESDKLYARAQGLIPSYSQVLAKGPTQFVNGVAPKYLMRGAGATVWDVDGNEFLDYNMGVGPISLGYCYPAVDEAIRAQLADGITFSLVHPLEVEVSELVRETVPCAEAVRFAKSGAEATSAAVRLARAFTGREKVLACGYHGWHDWYIGITARNGGVPEGVRSLVHTFSYTDIDYLKDAIDDETACIIMEPMVFDFPQEGFLTAVKEVAAQHGALLIFDEIWSGYRFDLGGAQTLFGVTPDIATFSKSVANGMPISIVAGRQEILARCDDDVFFYTTFGGEALSLAATKATITEMKEKNVPDHLAKLGQTLIDGYNQIAEEAGLTGKTACKGHPARSLITFDSSSEDPLLQKSLVQQEMIKRGVLWSGFHNMCFSHTPEHVAYTLEAYADVLPILKEGIKSHSIESQLRGEPVQPVFRKTSNFNIKPKK